MNEEEITAEVEQQPTSLDFYTIVHTYDGMNWYATGILSHQKADAISQFSTYTGYKDYRIVKIALPMIRINQVK